MEEAWTFRDGSSVRLVFSNHAILGPVIRIDYQSAIAEDDDEGHSAIFRRTARLLKKGGPRAGDKGGGSVASSRSMLRAAITRA